MKFSHGQVNKNGDNSKGKKTLMVRHVFRMNDQQILKLGVEEGSRL